MDKKEGKTFKTPLEKWNAKKHMSFKFYKTWSNVSLILSYLFIFLFFIFFFFGSITNGYDEEGMMEFPIFWIFLIALCLNVLLRFIISIVYGKRGEENLIKYSLKTKIASIPVFLCFAVVGLITLIMSNVLGWLALIFLPFIAVVVLGLIVICSIASALVLLCISGGNFILAILCLWSDSLNVFTYILTQRKVRNLKFKKSSNVLWLIFLWFPILDLIAMNELITLFDNNEFFIEKTDN